MVVSAACLKTYALEFRLRLLFSLLFVSLSFPCNVLAQAPASLPASAPASSTRYELHLLTMGPGSHVFTAAGHAAMMVVEYSSGSNSDVVVGSKVYNYGDADWADPALERKAVHGDLKFFVSVSPSLNDVVNEYGINQGREIFRQRLNLTDEQAARIAARLAKNALPENREYPYHHYRAICTTKLRDILDEELGGVLRAQLTLPAGYNVRYAQHQTFANHYLADLASNLFIGRLHDAPIDAYTGTFMPDVMRESFQKVKLVRDDGSTVMLASAPSMVTEFAEAEAAPTPGYFTEYLCSALAALLFASGGFWAFRRAPYSQSMTVWTRRLVAVNLIVVGLASSFVGGIIAFLWAWSNVPELHWNENLLLFPPFDVAVVVAGVSLLRGRGVPWLRSYANARFIAFFMVSVSHTFMDFAQQPQALGLLSVLININLLGVTQRLKVSEQKTEVIQAEPI